MATNMVLSKNEMFFLYYGMNEWITGCSHDAFYMLEMQSILGRLAPLRPMSDNLKHIACRKQLSNLQATNSLG